MVLDYLSVKNKYYLNGFDWVMGVIDLIMKKTTCAGNASQIVLMLDSPPDEAAYRDSLARFIRLFPVISGRVSRHYTGTPYWKMPKKNAEPNLCLTVTRHDGSGPERGMLEVLTRHVNTPFRNEQEHLAFHLVYGRGEQCLAMTFDHRLFDARGAESFMALFQEFLASDGDAQRVRSVRLTQGFDLTQWKHKFLGGQKVNRRIRAISKDPVRALPVSLNGGLRGFKYRVIAFDREATKRITGTAYDQAGYLMIMPYLFACVAEGLHRVFERRGAPSGAYVVPVSTDLRRAKDIREELFFNHNSMFFFQVKPEDAVDRKRLVGAVKSQMYEQVQIKFPEGLMAASALTRIAPLPLLRKIFHLPLEGKIASFCFSHVSKDSFASPELLGAKITNLFHMPRTPVPPGMGVFFNSFHGRLNATISWLDGLFTDAEMEALERDLRSSL
jgi:hypothetical protein